MGRLFGGLLGRAEGAIKGRDKQIKEAEERAVNGKSPNSQSKDKRRKNPHSISKR